MTTKDYIKILTTSEGVVVSDSDNSITVGPNGKITLECKDTEGYTDEELKNISIGFVEVKGKLKQIKSMTSPMTKSKCIGYNYSIMRFNSSRKRSVSSINRGESEQKERDKHMKWEDISSDTARNDFYIEDSSGKIKVKAKGISVVLLNVNQTDKKTSGTSHTENLLLPDDQEYVLIGTAVYNKKTN